jgi:peptidoglycan/LPS O-acetylase OafA/YrhL
MPAIAPTAPCNVTSEKTETPKTMGSNQAAHSYRSDIDGLRAVAVLAVVGFHTGIPGLSGGFVGVDVFFVISGFLISSIIFKGLRNGNFSLAEFYARRIRRIFPALILILLSVWLFGWSELMPQQFKQMGADIAGAAGFISNIQLCAQSGYFDRAAILKPLLHLWSLGIEEQFYLIWPLTLIVVWKSRFRLVILIGLLAGSFFINVSNVTIQREATFYMPQSRFWELLIGSCIAYIQSPHETALFFGRRLRNVFAWITYSKKLGNLVALTGLLLVAGSIVGIDDSFLFPGYAALLPTLGAALVISAGPNAWTNRKILSRRVLVVIGLISYPLYLWHWPVLYALRMSSLNQPSPAAMSIAIGFAFLLAWLTFHFVETPIRTGTSVFAKHAVALLMLAMLGTFSLGLLSVTTAGFPSRVSGEAYRFMVQNDEHVSLWRQDRCFLERKSLDWRSFQAECIDSEPKRVPLVFLWGDSHAADLYPGIRKLQSDRGRFRLAQFNSSSCAPILKYQAPSRKNCAEINDHVLRTILDSRPATVILASQHWPVGDTAAYSQLTETIVSLKHAGVHRVIIVGADPEWRMPLNELLAKSCTTIVSDCPPYRLDTSNLVSRNLEDDRALGAWVAKADATYVSIIDELCNADGCITRIQADNRSDLTSFDVHHLTPLASEYVAARIFSLPKMADLGQTD